MLRRGITRCGAAATLLAAAILAGPLTPVGAQIPADVQTGGRPALDTAPPEPAAAMGLYNAVDGWVRAWKTPMDPGGQPPLAAAALTIRYESSVVGRGMAIAPEPAGGSGILMMATGRALKEAAERMPLPQDALREENLRAAAPRLMLSVELAGRPVPIEPAEWADAVALVAPGLEGVAVRLGDRVEAMFPEFMLMTGTDAGAGLMSLVSKASGDPAMGLKKPSELRDKHGAVFYKFQVVNLAQTVVGGTAEFLHRGGRVVQMGEMTAAGLRAWAGELAAHLVAQTPIQNSGVADTLRGTLSPATGENETPDAGPIDHLLCSLALSTYAVRCGPEARAARAGDTAWDLVHALGGLDLEQSQPAIAALGAVWYRLPFVGRTVARDGEPLGMHAFLTRSPRAVSKLVDKDGSLADTVDRSQAGLVAYALALNQSDGQAPGAAEAVLRRILVATPPNMLVSQTPWLGWAELALHPTGEVPAAAALREMREQLWAHQLKADDVPPGAEDLAGGIVFTTARQPLPTWHAARPLAFVATMLGDPRLTEPRERSSELVRLLASLRYLRQLTASEAEAHMYKDPVRAVGGVRSSAFDQRMPPEATAMTLITVCETLKALDALEKQRAEQQKVEEKPVSK